MAVEHHPGSVGSTGRRLVRRRKPYVKPYELYEIFMKYKTHEERSLVSGYRVSTCILKANVFRRAGLPIPYATNRHTGGTYSPPDDNPLLTLLD